MIWSRRPLSEARVGEGLVGIDRRGSDTRVTEQDLDYPGIDTVLHQPGGIAVAQNVGRRVVLGEAGLRHRLGEGAEQHAGAEVVAAALVGEEPPGMVMAGPERPQALVDRLRQRDQALLVALADDPQHHAGAIDLADLEGRGLGDPQTAGGHQ